jgi:hypothetical protein
MLAVVLVGMALPVGLRHRSLPQFGKALLFSLAGVLLPLFTFLLSGFMTPDWKGACRWGWVDCFHSGKLALTPLVLWAMAAWYAVEVFKAKHPHRPWIILGLVVGAGIASVCAVFGWLTVHVENPRIFLWMLVPTYAAVWYTVSARQSVKAAGFSLRACLVAAGSSLPLWIGAVLWSRRVYEKLPDQPPSCFIVTAASRGHAAVVGPLVPVAHGSRLSLANTQLLAFWQLEARWQTVAPRSHRRFRRVYGIVGPQVARRIRHPLAADLVYLALKPAEWGARLLLSRLFFLIIVLGHGFGRLIPARSRPKAVGQPF